MSAANPNPLWQTDHKRPFRSPLEQDGEFDVVVVGGGIAGVTAALLLKRAGKRVALLEMKAISDGETGHTTAHLTELFDERYSVLARHFGARGAQLAAQSARAAIARIAQFVAEESIDCHFRRLPAYLYTESATGIPALKAEVEAARAAGVDARFTPDVPLPFGAAGALFVDEQADFHPRQYVEALANKLDGDGSRIYELTRALEVHDGAPCRVVTEGGTLSARDVIVASHSPFNNVVFLQTKVAAYRSYAVAARVSKLPMPLGLYWDTADPYHYTRTYRDGESEYLIVGGEDHKTGQADSEQSFQRLELYARERYGLAHFSHRWSGQILEPVDGLAFIGRNSASKNVFVATGFSGTGMTFGTIAGMLLSDEILGQPNEWAALYNATRIKPIAALKEFLSENVDYPLHFLKDRLSSDAVKSLSDIPAGEGRIVDLQGKKLAVFRSNEGHFRALSPICTHMSCVVKWNASETSWDCPCHGARYDTLGRVLNGPAREDLKLQKIG